MIDLIDECGKDICCLKTKKETQKKYAVEVTRFLVEDKKDEKVTGFDVGEYIILHAPLINVLDEECHDYVCQILMKNLKGIIANQRIKKKDKILIVGLGNPNILSDALGSKVLERIEINPLSKNNNVYKFTPNIFMATGIDSLDIIHMLVVWLEIDCVVLIDSLATKNVKRLGVSIQINNTGITPGSAVHGLGRKISKDTLGVPCFSIGVPLMLLAGEVVKDADKELILAQKDVHQNLDILAYIISRALNAIFC